MSLRGCFSRSNLLFQVGGCRAERTPPHNDILQTGDCFVAKNAPRNDIFANYKLAINHHHPWLDSDRLHATGYIHTHTNAGGGYSHAIGDTDAAQTRRCDDPVHRGEWVRASLRLCAGKIDIDEADLGELERHAARAKSGRETDRLCVQPHGVLEFIYAGDPERESPTTYRQSNLQCRADMVARPGMARF